VCELRAFDGCGGHRNNRKPFEIIVNLCGPGSLWGGMSILQKK
jgi:hypothetical protein